MFILFVVLAVVALLVLLSCIKIVPQAQAIVVERLGAYLDTWSVGVHFKMLIEKSSVEYLQPLENCLPVIRSLEGVQGQTVNFSRLIAVS